MIRKKRGKSELKEWILVQAYCEGESRRREHGVTVGREPREPGDYWIHKDDIYTGYFHLPQGGFSRRARSWSSVRRYQEIRLKCAVALSDTVRELLQGRFIRFPTVISSRTNRADLPLREAGRLYLTDAGVKKAMSLLSGLIVPECEGRSGDGCAA